MKNKNKKNKKKLPDWKHFSITTDACFCLDKRVILPTTVQQIE